MNRFHLSANRLKLLLTIVLSLILTLGSAPLIGKEEPVNPDLISLLLNAQTLSSNLKANTTSSLSRILPVFNSEKITPHPTINLAYPTRAIGFIQPTTVLPTSTTTTTAVNQNIPVIPTTAPDIDDEPESDKPTAVPDPINPQATRAPRPTKVPRPTRAPTPTPIKLTNPRPGKNFADAATIVGEAMCVPAAMIRATLDIEYGPWIPKVEADWVNRNTYKGSDPHDKPGSSVVPPGVVMQMMEDTWTKIKPVLAQKFGTNDLSLEVTFDSMLAGAYYLRNISLAMQDKVSCDDWPVKYILYGACRYNGACAVGSHTYNDYAYTVCNNYNKYTTGPKKNCK